jgi:enamine deaminase RidA (YjgF/YER057c/UK114 family)
VGKEIVSGDRINETLGPPIGPYAHGTIGTGSRMLFVAGQLPWDSEGNLVGKGDFEAQYRQVMRNIEAIVLDAGGQMRDICKVVNYVAMPLKDGDEAYAKLSAVRREFIPDDAPAVSTLVSIESLMDADALVETDAIAVLE